MQVAQQSGELNCRFIKRGRFKLLPNGQEPVLVGNQLPGDIYEVIQHLGPDPDCLRSIVMALPLFDGRRLGIRCRRFHPRSGRHRLVCREPLHQVINITGRLKLCRHIGNHSLQKIRPLQKEIGNSRIKDQLFLPNPVQKVFKRMRQFCNAAVPH